MMSSLIEPRPQQKPREKGSQPEGTQVAWRRMARWDRKGSGMER